MSAVKVGSTIPPSYSVETGVTGKVVGLLSNGTLLTLTENTRMKVSTFEQESFEDDGRKLADLPGEPSESKVTLDLDFGSLVVKTKKLNKGSSFDINSPVGVAGIRGTEFQMASALRTGSAVGCDGVHGGFYPAWRRAAHSGKPGEWIERITKRGGYPTPGQPGGGNQDRVDQPGGDNRNPGGFSRRCGNGSGKSCGRKRTIKCSGR